MGSQSNADRRSGYRSRRLFPPAAAQAQGADLTRLTCGRLLDQRGVEPERLLVWLHG
jgi:hypothetical protein